MLNFTPHPLVTMAVTALVPTIIGFIWYNPRVFGKAWMDATGMTMEKAQKDFNMPLVMGLSLLLSFMLSVALMSITIHQSAFFSMMASPDGQTQLADHNSALYGHVRAIYDMYGTNFRTFKHGLFHGILAGIFIALPIVATNAMFERKSFKYVAIVAGYWIVCLGIMGAIICHFMPYSGIYAIKGF